MEFNEISRVDCLAGLALAPFADSDGVIFIMTDVHDFRLEYINHFIKQIKYQLVGCGIGGAVNIGPVVVLSFRKLTVRHEQIIRVAEGGHFGNDFKAPVFTVFYETAHRVLGKPASAAVFKMDGIFCPRIGFVLNLVCPVGVSVHFLTELDPRFIDFRMALVLHSTAHFNDDFIVTEIGEHIHGFVEGIQVVGSRHIDL